MLEEKTYDQLHLLQQDVLVLFGEKDLMIPNVFLHPLTTKIVAKRACSMINKVHLVMIPFAGHFVFFEKAGEVNKKIESFIL